MFHFWLCPYLGQFLASLGQHVNYSRTVSLIVLILLQSIGTEISPLVLNLKSSWILERIKLPGANLLPFKVPRKDSNSQGPCVSWVRRNHLLWTILAHVGPLFIIKTWDKDKWYYFFFYQYYMFKHSSNCMP